MLPTLRSSSVLFAALCFSQSAFADSSMAINLGKASDARAAWIGFQTPVQPPLAFLRSPNISTHVEFSLGYWKGNKAGVENDELIDLAVLPVVRYFFNGVESGRFFLEGGIGAHLLSRTRIHESRRFGSAFQFGDVLGIGWRFGHQAKYEIGVRAQHVSNAGLKQPNQGINFLELRLVVPL